MKPVRAIVVNSASVTKPYTPMPLMRHQILYRRSSLYMLPACTTIPKENNALSLSASEKLSASSTPWNACCRRIRTAQKFSRKSSLPDAA